MCYVNFQLDQIQNGRLSAIINFDMPDTGQTVPDSTLTFKISIIWKVACTLLQIF